MLRIYIFIIAISVSLASFAASLGFTGQRMQPVEVVPEASTGLSAVYVVEDAGVGQVTFASAQPAVWYRFANLGGGYAEAVENATFSDGLSYIPAYPNDCGYIVEADGRRHCFWVINYANHPLDLKGISVDGDLSDCSRTALSIDGSADRLVYYTVNGRPAELSRDIRVEYNTLKFDEADSAWKQGSSQVNIPYISSTAYVDAPLCDTDFKVTGDRFLEQWGIQQSAVSDYWRTFAVDARSTAIQDARDNANESKTETDGLGGSAPCVVTFSAIPTDAAVFHEWQFSATPDFDNPSDRFTENEFTYTFDQQGTTYVRYVCGDADGRCFYEGSTYPVSVGASKLLCPNVFSPANQDGVNDEWKVSYTSIISFQCDIFNRWGTRLASFSDPSQGWDGRYNGKIVPSGTYFYVIKAVGADGVKYNLSGDINVLASRKAPAAPTE